LGCGNQLEQFLWIIEPLLELVVVVAE